MHNSHCTLLLLLLLPLLAASRVIADPLPGCTVLSLLSMCWAYSEFGRDTQLHLTRLALWEFQRVHHALPRLHSTEDATELLGLVRSILEQNKANPLLAVELDEAVVRNISLYARTELSPLCALFGGVLAQEITKQAGKYTPITQWFHFDAFELLSPAVPADATPAATRYDNQIAIFGRDFQQRLGRQKTFLVGCGALGCEYMKSFAMMGVGCAGGEITVTDDDRIELSNLSRQFLFRRKHVGLAKSISAGEAAIAMNPALKSALKTLETRVEPKSENIFDDAFWDGLDFVVNALDNQQARKYTDGKTTLHLKPLFESGTLGTQGMPHATLVHTLRQTHSTETRYRAGGPLIQVVCECAACCVLLGSANSVICLPHLTPSYSEGAVAGEEQGIGP